MVASQPQQPNQQTPYGRTYECGAHFYQGILHYDDTRWLTYLSAGEYKRYDAGDLKCIKLRPERGEIPRQFGDYLVYANRKFYRDPVVNWTDQPPPKSLKFYLADPKFRRYVRQESEMDTNVRARFERIEGEADTKAKAVVMTDIPEELWSQVQEWMKKKSSEQIAELISTPVRIITYGAVDRLKRHFIRYDLWKEQEVQVRNQIIADEVSRERNLALAQHLLEQSTDHIVRHTPIEGAELRKNASLYFEMAKFAQKNIDSNTRKLEDIELGKQTEARRGRAGQPDPQQKKIDELEAKIARLEQALAEKEAQAKPPPAPEPEEQTPEAKEEAPATETKAEPKAEAPAAPSETVADPVGFVTTEVDQEAASSPPSGGSGAI